MQHRRRSGFTLLELLFVILIIVIILTLVARACAATPPVFNKQTPTSIVVTPTTNTVRPNGTVSMTVTVTYPAAISTTRNSNVKVQIREDDLIGDVVLTQDLVVTFPPGATTASQPFTLTCKDPNSDGNYQLWGDDDGRRTQDVWHVYGDVWDQITSEAEEGDDSATVVCEEE